MPFSSTKKDLSQIETIHSCLMQENNDIKIYLQKLSKMKYDQNECCLAIISTLSAAILYKDITHCINEIVKCFSYLIQNEEEHVRRSCFILIAIISRKGFLNMFLSECASLFNSWNEKAKEMILSFVFSFSNSDVTAFECFLAQSEMLKESNNEMLSSIANDFISYLNSNQNNHNELTDSLKGQINIILNSSSGDDKLSSDNDNENDELYYAHPPEGKSLVRNSIRLPKSASLSPPTVNLEENIMNENNDIQTKNNTPPEVKKENTKIPKFSRQSKIVKPRVVPKTANVIQVNKNTDEANSNNLFDDDTTQIRMPKDSSNRSVRPPRRNKIFITTSLPDIIAGLRNNDWEIQQKSVENLVNVLLNDPSILSPHCKDIWRDVLDIITSPRTMLANIAIQFASSFYIEFPSQLSSIAPQYISTALNLCCSCHQFIAEGSFSILEAIARNSPKSKVLIPFINGTKHKNSIARGKACQCLFILLEKEQVDEKDMNKLITIITPLLRDLRAETRDSARKVLKVLSHKEGFDQRARNALSNFQLFNEMKKMIE